MTPDEERWAEALAVLRIHGEQVDEFIAERLAALRSDPAGTARWQEIADRVRQLRTVPEQPS